MADPNPEDNPEQDADWFQGDEAGPEDPVQDPVEEEAAEDANEVQKPHHNPLGWADWRMSAESSHRVSNGG